MAIAAILVLGSAFSVWQAVRATSAAESERSARLEARKNLYIADMNGAQTALQAGNMERAITVLERHIPSQERTIYGTGNGVISGGKHTGNCSRYVPMTNLATALSWIP